VKLIIAGSRTLYPLVPFIDSIIAQNNIKVTEVVSGGARGVDICGEKFQECYSEMGVRYHNPVASLKLTRFPADWNTHGKAAGPIRNKQMAEYADALLLIWDGESSGSRNMKETMLKLGKPVYEVILKTHGVS
jgi:predicted Rossmann fold nucleotide-binding protein DprA/Smf involved in DNA uptake